MNTRIERVSKVFVSDKEVVVGEKLIAQHPNKTIYLFTVSSINEVDEYFESNGHVEITLGKDNIVRTFREYKNKSVFYFNVFTFKKVD